MTLPLSSQIMRTPRSVDIEITSRCNLACRYCYYFDNPKITYNDLPKSEWLKFIDELARCSVMNVTLQGGEPFIRKDLKYVLEKIIQSRMRFSILTNGTLIDEENARFLSQTNRCDIVQISIDGDTPEVHDIFRGPGSFEKAIEGVRTLQAYGIPVTARVTLHRKNFRHIKAIAHFLLDELNISSISTNSVGYLGRTCYHSEGMILTIEERQSAMQDFVELIERYGNRISAMAGPLAEWRTWKKMESARKRGEPPFSEGGKLTGCGCTNSKITIRSDGAIVPCSMLPNVELGRINVDSLENVWQHHPILNELRNRHRLSLKQFEYCETCAYIPYCTGNCPAIAYRLIGQIHHPSPDACLKRFLENGGQIP